MNAIRITDILKYSSHLSRDICEKNCRIHTHFRFAVQFVALLSAHQNNLYLYYIFFNGHLKVAEVFSILLLSILKGDKYWMLNIKMEWMQKKNYPSLRFATRISNTFVKCKFTLQSVAFVWHISPFEYIALSYNNSFSERRFSYSICFVLIWLLLNFILIFPIFGKVIWKSKHLSFAGQNNT